MSPRAAFALIRAAEHYCYTLMDMLREEKALDRHAAIDVVQQLRFVRSAIRAARKGAA